MINETILFNCLRSMTSDRRLSQIQVDSVHAILESCTKHAITDKRQIAYIIATAFHESRLKPIEEIGHGAGHPYGKFINGHVYYGRGYTQLTWLDNYKTFSKVLGVDLVNRPELALVPEYAAEIMVIGMSNGMFTGVGLKKYFNENVTDPIHARKIVNGLDCANLIAGYYSHIISSLS